MTHSGFKVVLFAVFVVLAGLLILLNNKQHLDMIQNTYEDVVMRMFSKVKIFIFSHQEVKMMWADNVKHEMIENKIIKSLGQLWLST